MKIISSKEYKKLKTYEDKYNLLIGQTFTIYNGGRSRRKSLLMLDKEELVRIIFDYNNELIKLSKKLKKSDK